MLVGERDGTTRGTVSVDDLLRVLSCTKRREILAALSREPLSVSALQRILGYAMSDVSRHLRELRDAGLVSCESVKKEHIYRLARHAVVDVGADSICIQIDNSDPFQRVLLKRELHSSALQTIASGV